LSKIHSCFFGDFAHWDVFLSIKHLQLPKLLPIKKGGYTKKDTLSDESDEIF